MLDVFIWGCSTNTCLQREEKWELQYEYTLKRKPQTLIAYNLYFIDRVQEKFERLMVHALDTPRFYQLYQESRIGGGKQVLFDGFFFSFLVVLAVFIVRFCDYKEWMRNSRKFDSTIHITTNTTKTMRKIKSADKSSHSMKHTHRAKQWVWTKRKKRLSNFCSFVLHLFEFLHQFEKCEHENIHCLHLHIFEMFLLECNVRSTPHLYTKRHIHTETNKLNVSNKFID